MKQTSVLESSYVRHVTNMLERALKSVRELQHTDEMNINLLKQVAYARLSLVGASSILCQRYLTDYKISDAKQEKEFKQLLALLTKFIMAAQNSDGHMFLLRQIIRNYGNRELQLVIEQSQINCLNLQRATNAQVCFMFLFYAGRSQEKRNIKIDKLFFDCVGTCCF